MSRSNGNVAGSQPRQEFFDPLKADADAEQPTSVVRVLNGKRLSGYLDPEGITFGDLSVSHDKETSLPSRSKCKVRMRTCPQCGKRYDQQTGWPQPLVRESDGAHLFACSEVCFRALRKAEYEEEWPKGLVVVEPRAPTRCTRFLFGLTSSAQDYCTP